MDVEVGQVVSQTDLTELGDVLAHAFAFDRQVAGQWFDRAGHDEVRLARVGVEVVGGLLRVPMGQAFGGRFVPMIGIAAVGVRADKRRKGIATEMMRQVLIEQWESGVPLSTLYASNQPLYRSVGYEQAGAHWRGTILPREIEVRETEGGPTTMAGDHDHEAIEALYRAYALARPGHLDRGRYIWSRIRQPLDGSQVRTALLWDERDQLEAYVSTFHVKSEQGIKLHVHDAVSRTARGWRRIWTHLSDVSTIVREIHMSTSPTDPLFVLQPHPYMKVTLWEPFMLRVVDPANALEARGYAKGQPERVAMRVIDPLLGDVALTLDVEGGRARVRKGGDPTARVHIRGLSAMYTGYMSPWEAAALGLVEAGPRTLAALQSLFAGPAPWMRDSF